MDILTNKHGLAPVYPTQPLQAFDINKLSYDLTLELERLTQLFTVDAQKLKEISQKFEKELQDGKVRSVRTAGCRFADHSRARQVWVKHCMHFIYIDDDIELMGEQSMNVTWVLGWPDGHEQGQFLTTDLGGTNLRVCWVTLKERKGETEMTQEEFKLSDEVKVGDGEDLFNFIAECLGNFIKKHKIEGTKEKPIQLGFTFSYPAHQDYIDHGKLVTWTKGFEVKGVEGNDAAGMLRDAMGKKVSNSMPPNDPYSFLAGPTDTLGCTDKRHHRCNDRISIRRPGYHSRCDIWHWLQWSVYGGGRLNTQTRH